MLRPLIPLLALVTLLAGTSYGTGAGLGIASISPFVPNPVNITSGSQTVTLNFTLSNPSNTFVLGYVYLYDTYERAVAKTYFNSSNGQGNQYSFPLTIPRYASPGNWRVAFDLVDTSFSTTPISGTIVTPGDDKFLVLNTGATDEIPPIVNSVSFFPKVVDTSAAAQSIQLTINLFDGLSGIQFAVVNFLNPAGEPVNSLLKTVTGAEIVNGSFSFSRTLPLGSAPGIWRIEVTVKDNVGNVRKYDAGETTGFPEPEDATFTIGPVPDSSFTKFVKAYSLTGNNAKIGANPDNDWASNGLEFLFGLNPTVPTAPKDSIYRVTRQGNALWLDFTPSASLIINNNGDFLNVANAAGDPPVRLTGQTATSPAGPWTNTRPQLIVGNLYRVILPMVPGGRGFVRLAVLDP